MTDPRTPADESAHQVMVAASFTAEPLEPVIGYWSGRLALPMTVGFAGFDQVFQQLLDAEGPMARNTRGLNVILLRWTDLAPTGQGPSQIIAELADAVRNAAARWAVPVLVVICPDGDSDASAALDSEFTRELRDVANVHVFTPDDLSAWYPGDVSADAYSDRLGRVPYTSNGFTAIGTAIVRRLYRILAPEPKVVVVDADNTLWDGVAGEGELTDVVIGPARQALQNLLAAQRQAGRLLCLCSKNAPDDTMAVISGHPGMRLSAQDFAATRINWQSKSGNLRELADELKLGLDTFVFIDDNPLECAEVRAQCPQATVLELPPDATDAERFLRHCWVLDIGTTTTEDSRRAEYYRTEVERERTRRAAPTLQGFLDSLDLRVHIERAGPADASRIAQLTQRTNQFNLSGIRRTELEIRDLPAAWDCLVVTVEDRFGSYGQVGVVIGVADGTALRLETFLLSCRALGRGVEHRILAHVGALASARGLRTVELDYVPTSRNQPAADFLRDLSGLALPSAHGIHSIPSVLATTVTYAPPSQPTEATAAAAARIEPSESLGRRLWLLADQTAPDLPSAALIEQRMRIARPAGDESTATAAAVAALMAEVIGVTAIGEDDNFFELGGTSIQLISFMAAIRDRFGIELPTDTMYNSELTARGISASVLLHSTAGPGTVDDVLALVESLTDEQIEAMLVSLELGEQ